MGEEEVEEDEEEVEAKENMEKEDVEEEGEVEKEEGVEEGEEEEEEVGGRGGYNWRGRAEHQTSTTRVNKGEICSNMLAECLKFHRPRPR